MENWKPVIGYDGYYEISDRGRVRSVTRTVNTGINNSETKVWKGRMLKLNLKNNGYLTFDASKENKVKTFTVHREVAKAFIENIHNKPEINHINAIKTDNRVENLEWCTRKENAEHAVKEGLYNNIGGRKILCVELDKTFSSSTEAAKWLNETKFKYSKDVTSMGRVIRNVCVGKIGRKSAYGYKWKDI